MKHRVKVRPVRVRRFDAQLDVFTSRIVGYRLVCSCGFRTSTRATVRLALDDGAEARAHTMS